MPRIIVNLSFDHELSLGGVSSTFDQNLFAPTREILQLADSLEVPVTLYTDVMCGIRFREWHNAAFFEPYEEQLQEALHRGHDVQLHVHPHWVDVERDGARFIASDRYSLHDFRGEAEPNDIDGLIRRGVNYLTEVCSSAQPDYRCIAYRAGGLAITQSSEPIVSSLLRHGIRIDSSIAPGYSFQSPVNSVDFSNTPGTVNWHVSATNDVLTAADTTDDSLFELPIVTTPRNPLNNLPALARRLSRRSLAPRSGGVTLYDIDASAFEKFKRLFPFSSWMLSFDLYWSSGDFLLKMLQRYLKQYRLSASDEVFVSALSHPKSMGKGGLDVMRQFVTAARRTYGSDIEFLSCPEIDKRRRL